MAPTVQVEKDFMGTVHIKMAYGDEEPFDFVQIQYRYGFTDNSSQRLLADRIVALITGQVDAELAAVAAERDDYKRGAEVEAKMGDEARAELRHAREQLQSMIDQTTPLEPVPGDPKWSRRIQLDEVIAERDQLRAEVEREQAYREILQAANAGLAEKAERLGAEVEALQRDRKACWEEFKALRRSSDATDRELRAEVEALRKDAERWEKCKSMPKAWWLEAMAEASRKGGRSLDEQIDAAMAAKEGE